MFNLQDSRSLPNPSARDLATTLDQALSIITQLAKSASETAAGRASSPTSTRLHSLEWDSDNVHENSADLEHILIPQLRVVKSFLPFLLEIFDEIGHLQDGAPLQRSLTYNFTTVFRNLFQRICELANTFAAHAEASNSPGFSSQFRQGQMTYPLPQHPPLLLALCDIGLALVNGLDCAKASHSNVMEGCLYTILREIGYRLRESVFGPLKHIPEDTFSTRSDSQHRRTVLPGRAAQSDPAADSLYMIYILERIPSLQRAFPLHAQSQDQAASQFESQSTRDSPQASRFLNSGKLISGASLQFQHTLLKAVFGEKQAADFEPSLSEPQEGEVLNRGGSQLGQESIQNWFKREVWRLVGWEVLRSKLDTEYTKHS